MAGYKPKYSQQRTGRQSLLTRFRRAVASVSKGRGRSTGVKRQAVVAEQQRKRQVRSFSRTTVVLLCLAAVLSVVGWYGYRVLDRSDIFRLTRVSVLGNRMTSQDRVLELGAIEQGVSLLSFDAAGAEERIARHPWIESVEVVRSWPSTLKIMVHEHRPLAMINVENEEGSMLYYVDRRRRVFAAVEGSHDLDYPVLTGIEAEGELAGTTISDKGLAGEAFEFLRLAARGNPIVPLQTISEVNVSAAKGIVVYLVDQPFPIYMGYDNIRKRYSHLVKLLERLYRKEKIEEIKEIHMDYQEGRILVAKVAQ